MRRGWLIALVASLPSGAWALEGVEATLRSRSLEAAAALPAATAEAPFRARRDPMPGLILREELARRATRGGCEHASELCYDLAEGRVVYRPARAWMPPVEGLRAESISLRRDRVVFKYSFR
jgi:hypothetical protein